MKTFTVRTQYGVYDGCTFVQNRYAADGSLALDILTRDKEPFARITVCLMNKLGANVSYIDTNNCPWAVELLESLNIAARTGGDKASGYCIYPAMLFDMEKLSEYCE